MCVAESLALLRLHLCAFGGSATIRLHMYMFEEVLLHNSKSSGTPNFLELAARWVLAVSVGDQVPYHGNCDIQKNPVWMAFEESHEENAT